MLVTEWEVVINLKTAKALGHHQRMLQRLDLTGSDPSYLVSNVATNGRSAA